MLILCWRLQLGLDFWAGDTVGKCQAHPHSLLIWPPKWLKGQIRRQSLALKACHRAIWLERRAWQLSTSALRGRRADRARSLRVKRRRSLPWYIQVLVQNSCNRGQKELILLIYLYTTPPINISFNWHLTVKKTFEKLNYFDWKVFRETNQNVSGISFSFVQKWCKKMNFDFEHKGIYIYMGLMKYHFEFVK